MDALPLFTALSAAKRVLVAGAGGGFDVMSGLPLAFALRRMGKTVRESIYCIEKVGVAPMREVYRELRARLDVDAIVLVDGGTDILMSGDEAGLGTPAEDITSLLGAHAVDVPTKLVVSIGFGVDTFHGVAHAVRGCFGDHRSVPRIAGATKPLFINPLMSLVWTFDLGAVARRCLYRRHIDETQTIFEVAAAIEAFRKTMSKRERRTLPM